jgi:hypothetical protein
MRRMMAFAIAFVTFAISLSLPTSALADDTTKRCGKTGRCYVVAKKHRKPPIDGETTIARGSRPQGAASDRRVNEATKRFAAALAVYDRQLARYKRCLRASRNAAACGQAPESPWLGGDSFSGPGNQPITAGQAAAIAVARLQLPTIAPGIGPSPDLNRWNMAAVGYPLWLWADGRTHVGPISDSVGGLSVSLDAKVSSLAFRMGDGHSVTCPGVGQQWTTTVEPGAKSPSCGYSYTKPSLPNGSYTVAAIANWAVTWTSNGQSGVINVPAVDTTELPVGELQVLVR